MKKYCLLFSAAILSVFALSCSKADNSNDGVLQNEGEQSVIEDKGEIPEGYVRLSFAAEAEETKTTIADGEGSSKIVSWAVGDKVKVSYAGGSTETQAEEAGATSTFTVDVPEGTGQLYFSYPSTAAASLSDGTLSLTIPAVQDGAFEKANYLLATAATSDSGMRFYNAGSLFKIVVDDATLTKAEITGNDGEALCGTVPYTFAQNGITPGTATETGTKITVNFNGAGTYYVSALPGLSLTDGATLRFFRGDVPAGGAKWSGDQTVARASIKSWGNSDKITNRYVTVSGGASTKNGRSWETAWGLAEMKAFLTNSAARTAEQLALMDGITVKVAAGTYNMAGTSIDWSAYDETGVLTVHFVGGYPAAGGDTPDASVNETIFSGNDEGRTLWVYQKSYLTFDGFTFSNGSTSEGGKAAVLFSHDGTADLKDCTFKNNTNTKTSGALDFSGGGTFTATDCSFENNTAAYAGAVNVAGASTTATFSNCAFTGNTANAEEDKDGTMRNCGQGGALKVTDGTVTIANSTFTDNAAAGSQTTNATAGGALWIAGGTVTISDCTLTNNSAHQGGAARVAGTSPNVTVEKCKFYKNSSGEDGGVFYFDSSTSTATIDDCDFGDGTDANQNSAGSGHYGGVFCINKTASLTIQNSRFNNNTAHGGGAIVLPGTADSSVSVNVTGCTFTNHTVSNVGGVLRAGKGTLNLENCTFTDNSSAGSGGVINLYGATINDVGSVYKRNHATWGGVIVTSDGTLNLTSCTFGTDGVAADKNYAEANGSGGAGGGGVINCNGGDINLIKCAFYGNEAQNRPGGVLRRATDGEANTITIKGCTFKGNVDSYDATGGGGGALYFQKGTLNIQKADDGTRNTFLNNSSFVRGGAICVDGEAVATISESDFTDNSTNKANYLQAGGALTVAGKASVSLTDCSFVENYTQQPNYGGGAIGTVGTTTTLKADKCLFKGNHAQQGGAFATYSIGGTVYLNACVFTGNHSYGSYGCVILLPNTKVDNNTPTNTLCMNNCSFADNQYTNSGNGQQSCWINMKGLTKLVMSNSSLIGRTRKSSGTADDTTPNLLRFDGAVGSGNYLINNIIAMTPTSGTFYSSDMRSSTVTGYYNKLSAVTGDGNYTPGEGSASDFKGTSTYFGGLGASMTEGNPAKWDNCYWSWNGTLATGGNLNKATLTNVNSTIQTADADFYNWLNSIGALDKDCRGKTRGATTWPGAYDGTNN